MANDVEKGLLRRFGESSALALSSQGKCSGRIVAKRASEDLKLILTAARSPRRERASCRKRRRVHARGDMARHGSFQARPGRRRNAHTALAPSSGERPALQARALRPRGRRLLEPAALRTRRVELVYGLCGLVQNGGQILSSTRAKRRSGAPENNSPPHLP